MPKITKMKKGNGYVLEFDSPMEAITDYSGTITFVYLQADDFKKLIDMGEQFLLDDEITQHEEEKKEKWRWN